MMSIHTKWVVAALVIVWLPVTSIALPMFFVDQVFKSIDQLDEALAAGEITGEEYELVRDALLGGDYFIDPEYPPEKSAIITSGAGLERRKNLQFGYRSTHRVTEDHVHHGQLRIQYGLHELGLQLEDRSSKGMLVRRRRIELSIGSRSWLSLGDIYWNLSSPLTFGATSSPGALRQDKDLGSSLAFPTRTVQNGIGWKIQPMGSSRIVRGYLSHVEGERHYRTSFALALEQQGYNRSGALAVLYQSIGEFGKNNFSSLIFAPRIHKRYLGFSFIGESSVIFDRGSAHEFRIDREGRGNMGLAIIAFSYGRNYKNVESSGYAYADYSTTEIPEIDFEYSDKRTGRRGVAIETEYLSAAQRSKIRSELVRWRNVLEDRDCIAARVNWTWKDRDTLALVRSFRLQGLWEDFDLATSAADARKWLTGGTEIRLSSRIRAESLLRVGLRTLNGKEREEWRVRQELEASVRKYLRLGLAADWRDSDWGSGGNEKLMLSVSDRYSDDRGNAVAVTVLSRYYPERGQVDDWEVRLDTKLNF